jgi:transcriptional regulator with XRE-family HTH domain
MEKINTKKIQNLLKQKGSSQVEFANAIGTKAPLISAAFHGARDIPMNKILKISKYFDVSPFDIVIKDEASQPQQKVSA